MGSKRWAKRAVKVRKLSSKGFYRSVKKKGKIGKKERYLKDQETFRRSKFSIFKRPSETKELKVVEVL